MTDVNLESERWIIGSLTSVYKIDTKTRNREINSGTTLDRVKSTAKEYNFSSTLNFLNYTHFGILSRTTLCIIRGMSTINN